MGFTVAPLMGDRYHVSGTDSTGNTGSTVLDGKEWNDIKRLDEQKAAQQTFEDVVESFFAPLLEAAKSVEVKDVGDDIDTFVLDEGSVGCDARPAQILKLHGHTVVLRLIDEDQEDRLLWIDGKLEVLMRQELPASVTSDVGDVEYNTE